MTIVFTFWGLLTGALYGHIAARRGWSTPRFIFGALVLITANTILKIAVTEYVTPKKASG